MMSTGYPNLAQAHTITETKKSLHQLDNKIQHLQHHLSQTHDQESQLRQDLLKTNQLISQNVEKLTQIQQQLTAKKAQITTLQQEVDTLSQQEKTLQTTLAKHIRARYKHPMNQPLTWLFLNTRKNNTDKMLTYYQYLIRAHQKTLTQLKDTQAQLVHQQQLLQQELDALNQLQLQWQAQQQQLTVYQNQRKTLLFKLTHTIASEEKTLNVYQQNRHTLSQILLTLTKESVIHTRKPMGRMKTKLPQPVRVSPDHIQKLNQGIILYSPEGSAVYSVYPGKVVFCDWLNGYGLLMIVDHGWGLMTLYANNLAFTKQKGDTVNQGEQIAKVGHSGTLKESGLYFEVRRYGKAVPPLEWLEH